MTLETLEKKIKVVEHFPKHGINFLDFSPILADGELFASTVDMMCTPFKDQKISKVVAIESRGFILGAAMAHKLGAG